MTTQKTKLTRVFSFKESFRHNYIDYKYLGLQPLTIAKKMEKEAPGDIEVFYLDSNDNKIALFVHNISDYTYDSREEYISKKHIPKSWVSIDDVEYTEELDEVADGADYVDLKKGLFAIMVDIPPQTDLQTIKKAYNSGDRYIVRILATKETISKPLTPDLEILYMILDSFE